MKHITQLNTRGKSARALLLTLALALAMPALAQAPASNNTVSREREALRRAQAALQQATQERDALQSEQSRLSQASSAAETRLRSQSASLAQAQRELKQANETVQTLQAEMQTARQQQADTRTEAQTLLNAAEQRWRSERSTLTAQSDERLQANRALAERLQTTNAALATAQDNNRRLHALGLEAVDRFRGVTPTDRLLRREPVLGLADVAAEDTAEGLRQRLDALRLPAAPR